MVKSNQFKLPVLTLSANLGNQAMQLKCISPTSRGISEPWSRNEAWSLINPVDFTGYILQQTNFAIESCANQIDASNTCMNNIK